MIRTQVYFPDNLYHAVQEAARRESISMAEKIRASVVKGLGLKLQKKKPKSFLTALQDISFSGRKGTPQDLAINHNKYLYGK